VATSVSLTTPFENPKLEPTSPAVENHKTKTKTKNFRTFKMSKKRVRKFQHFHDEQKNGDENFSQSAAKPWASKKRHLKANRKFGVNPTKLFTRHVSVGGVLNRPSAAEELTV
jgi:hypothetical protein